MTLVTSRGLEVDRVDVEPAGPVAGEGDGPAVGAEGRVHLLLDLHLDRLDELALEDVEDHQAAAALALGEGGDVVAVGREGEVAAHARADGQELRRQVLVAPGVALGQVGDRAPRAGVVEHDVEVAAGDRERRHQVAGRRRRRRDHLLDLALVVAERPSEVGGLAGLDQLRQVLLAQPAAEVEVEVLGVDPEGALDRPVGPAAERVAELEQEVAEALLAPALLDEVEGGVAETVGEEAGGAALQDRRDRVVDHRVAQVHLVRGGLVLRHVATPCPP